MTKHMELQLEHAQAMAHDSPNVFLRAALNIASVDFFTVLNRFDTDALIKRLHEKPELYFPMINSYANLMQASLQQQKLEFKQKQAQAKQREREQKLRARKPILLTDPSLDTFHQILTRRRRREEADSPAGPNPQASTPPASGIKDPAASYCTANTGESNIIELPALENEPALQEDRRWHEWSEDHSGALVCPS